MNLESSSNEQHRMQCMEVWGGHQAVDRSVRMTGIDVVAYSRVYRDSDRGGDVLYISSCASGRISRVLIADVSGHGDDAQGIARSLRDLMRKNINRIDQRRMMAEVNREFSEAQHSDRFATAVLMTYFLPNRSLVVSTAGHPAPLVYRHAQRRWECLANIQPAKVAKASGLPFGISDDEQYGTTRLRLDQGDLVICYSDAFIEAVNANDEMLGVEGLLNVVRESTPDEASSLLPHIVSQIEALNPTNLRDDDATAVLITPNAERVAFADNLKAPGRWLSGLWRS